MKLKHYFSGALLLGLMASCSNDLPENPGQILENETTTYVRVSLVGHSSNTRADGFEVGEKEESDVKSIKLTFFDAGRNYVGDADVDVSNDNIVKDDGPADFDNTVERILTVVAKVDLPENINYPKYVIAYVNPTSDKDDLTTDKLEDAMCFIRERETVSHEGYRTMNNSVYFDNTNGYTRFATEVDFKTHFFDSFDKAKDATGNQIITITVERMEAKVRLNSMPAANKISAVEGGADNEYSLTFVPEAWFVNGTEKRSFLIKNYRTARHNYIYDKVSDNIDKKHMPASDIADFGFRFAALNNAFTSAGQTMSTSLNDFDNKRSYWAIDPTYFYEGQGPTKDYYPDISYDVKYGDVNSTSGKYYPLEYRSYNNAVAEYNAHEDNAYVKFNDANYKTHEYVLENTLSNNTLHDTDAKAAMTSVVLLGHYVVKKNGTEVFNGSTAESGEAFYVRHEVSGSKNIMIDGNEAIDFFMERSGSTFFVKKRDADGNIIKDKDGNDEYEPIRAAHLDPERDINENHIDYGIRHSDFRLEYPSKEFTQGSKLSEQWRTLRVTKGTNGYNENIYVYDAGTGLYKQLNSLEDIELTELYKRMYSTFGVIEKFEQGKSYFNIPLKHIWGKLSDSSNEFKPESVKLGDYGVVRNHIYDLTINSISGLGTGIGDLKQPIVPPTDNEQYYISTRLNILQWRVVRQNVDL